MSTGQRSILLEYACASVSVHCQPMRRARIAQQYPGHSTHAHTRRGFPRFPDVVMWSCQHMAMQRRISILLIVARRHSVSVLSQGEGRLHLASFSVRTSRQMYAETLSAVKAKTTLPLVRNLLRYRPSSPTSEKNCLFPGDYQHLMCVGACTVSSQH